MPRGRIGRWGGGTEQTFEQVDVLGEVPRPEEEPADLLPRSNAQAGRLFGPFKEIHDGVRERIEVVWLHQQPSLPLANLVSDAAHPAGHNRAPLPHCLGHGEAETFGQALLNDYGGLSL